MAEQILTEDQKRVIALMEILVKTGNADRQQTRELFNLHNQIFNSRETGIQCASCRSRVFNRMKEYYDQIKTKE